MRLSSCLHEQGLGILEAVMGQSAAEIDISASPVPENSLPTIVESAADLFPPMFLLHGLADELVVATQSARLCGALGGNIEAAGERADYLAELDLRVKRDCDERGSQMHLIREGDHALEVCLSSNVLLATACKSGSADSRKLVADSVTQSVGWASDVSGQRLIARDAALNMESDEASETAQDLDGDSEAGTVVGSTANEGSASVKSGGGGQMSFYLLFMLGLLLCLKPELKRFTVCP